MHEQSRTLIVDALAAPIGTKHRIQGWIRTRRDSKAGLSFLNVNDGSCFDNLQVVAPGELSNYEDTVLRLTTGCSVTVEGELVASQGAGQTIELRADTIELVGDVEDPDTYPVSAKRHSFEYLRSVAHLRSRTNTFGAVARVRHCLSYAVHDFLHRRRFLYIHTPIITASDCEGAGEMFRVSTLDLLNRENATEGQPAPADYADDFFGREAYLTVSGQLSVESYCCSLSNVYTFGPTFRAENSNTSRHLAEFWMIEPEIAFGDLADDATLVTAFLKHLIRTVLEERADDMKFFDLRIKKGLIDSLHKVVEADFARVSYTDAIAELEKAKKKFEFPVKWGIDLQSEHERFLTEELYQQPIIVIDYPKEIKAFYMRLNDDEKTVAAMDVMVPGIGEIVGGSQREERLDVLDRRIDEMGLPREPYWWYRDLRRYGTVPHAGFGLGFERMIQYVTGMANIRDVIPFPRTPRSADF
ncbi:MAG: asparagine--tRNA ligase [Planctomycetes bacterium]|nr:asparagine--tRNA ligase [Planctomycetota bacterium]NOG55512.1 asparagine--tRNA ligase [Planctomycetota bacterium]